MDKDKKLKTFFLVRILEEVNRLKPKGQNKDEIKVGLPTSIWLKIVPITLTVDNDSYRIFLEKYFRDYLGNNFVVSLSFKLISKGTKYRGRFWVVAKCLLNIKYKSLEILKESLVSLMENLLDDAVENPYEFEIEKQSISKLIGEYYDKKLIKLTQMDINSDYLFQNGIDRNRVRIFRTLNRMEKEGLIEFINYFEKTHFAFDANTQGIFELDEMWKTSFFATEYFLKTWEKIKEKKLIAPKIKSNPIFEENPPKITWGDVIVPIPYGSKQLCACRVLFKKKKGEIVEWDEIMSEIKGEEDMFDKNDWRKVYDAVKEVNKKVKDKTGKDIFKTSRKSFSRLE